MPAAPSPLVSILALLRIETLLAPAKMPLARSPVVVRLPRLRRLVPGFVMVSASWSNPVVEMFLRFTIVISPPNDICAQQAASLTQYRCDPAEDKGSDSRNRP